MTAALTARLRARRTTGGETRTYRLANSIRLPFGLGLAPFLVLALGTALLVGRVDQADLDVPGAVRAYQGTLTNEVAESIRRGVNEGVDDLDQLARELELGGDATLLVERFASLHGRYESVYVLGPDGAIRATAGTVPPAPELLDGRNLDDRGMHVQLEGGAATILQYAPVPDITDTVVAHYSPVFLRLAMSVAAPGDAWLVADDGRVIAGLGGAAPGTLLGRGDLATAARRAGAGRSGTSVAEGGALSRDVVAWTPVRGVGIAGNRDWGVVTVKRVDAAGLGAPTKRGQALGFAALLAMTAAALFLWLRNIILKPLLTLQREAERLAYGDLSAAVPVERYDEIGMTARALERMRVLLIRHRMRRR